jgi:hypothetical protein
MSIRNDDAFNANAITQESVERDERARKAMPSSPPS